MLKLSEYSHRCDRVRRGGQASTLKSSEFYSILKVDCKILAAILSKIPGMLSVCFFKFVIKNIVTKADAIEKIELKCFIEDRRTIRRLTDDFGIVDAGLCIDTCVQWRGNSFTKQRLSARVCFASENIVTI